MSDAVMSTSLTQWPKATGKVRDIYDLGDRLLIVATDRISAYDHVMPNGIPDKGKVLTQLSVFWFETLVTDWPHHMIEADVNAFDLPLSDADREVLRGRSMLVRKTDVLPIECVARGYLSGSGWREYSESGTVCGIALPEGLKESDRLPETIFTPATKATTGHDENVSFERAAEVIGAQAAETIRSRTIALYEKARDFAAGKGVLIADTKFEWGSCDDGIILIDEVLTPDSSRFWPADTYAPGGAQASYDKQFVRDYLTGAGWDRESSPPTLPDDVVARTREKYIEAYERLTDRRFEP